MASPRPRAAALRHLVLDDRLGRLQVLARWSTYAWYSSGPTTRTQAPHRRVRGPVEGRRLTRVDALLVGPEPGLGDARRGRPAPAPPRAGIAPAVNHVGGGDVEHDGGVDRHDELAVGEGPAVRARRRGTRTATATAARSRRSRAGRPAFGSSPVIGSCPVADSSPSSTLVSGRPVTPTCAVWLAEASRPPGPLSSTSRALVATTTPNVNTAAATIASPHRHAGGRAAARRDLARRIAPLGAEARRGKQRGQDHGSGQDHHDQHDPVGRLDVVGVRGVRRGRTEDRRPRGRGQHQAHRRAQHQGSGEVSDGQGASILIAAGLAPAPAARPAGSGNRP